MNEWRETFEFSYFARGLREFELVTRSELIDW